MNKVNFIKSTVEFVATGAIMIATAVTAKVGLAFHAISTLPTAAQFGTECLSTLMQNKALIGGTVAIALITDKLADILIDKVLEKHQENKKLVALGYLLKKVITVAAVVGFTVLMGASPIVAIATLTLLIARDILKAAFKNCCKKAEQQFNNEEINNQPSINDQPNPFQDPHYEQLNANLPPPININNQPNENINNQPNENINNQPNEDVNNQPNEEVNNQPNGEVNNQPNGEVNNQPNEEVNNQPNEEVNNQPTVDEEIDLNGEDLNNLINAIAQQNNNVPPNNNNVPPQQNNLGNLPPPINLNNILQQNNNVPQPQRNNMIFNLNQNMDVNQLAEDLGIHNNNAQPQPQRLNVQQMIQQYQQNNQN